ncbi:MAG: collagen-binding domain-containing protein [Verrucomicrobiota bacterium]
MKLRRLLPAVLLLRGAVHGADLRDANAIIFSDITSDGGHSEGGIIVGGDWNGTHYEIRQHSESAKVQGAGLVLKGDNLTSTGLRIFDGDAIYGGSGGTFDMENGAVLEQSVDMTANETAAADSLAYFRSLTGTPIDTSDLNNVRPDLDDAPVQNGFHVFTLAASEVTGNRTLDFSNADADDVIVINLTGDNLDWNWSSNFNPRQLLWTYQGSLFTINSREFVGSLLAPGASVIQNQNINGTVIANTLQIQNSVELHNFTFLSPIGEIPSVPEPAAALLTVLAGALLAGRRRETGRP